MVKYRHFVLLLGLFICSISFAQDNLVDSMQKVLLHQSNDTNKINTLIELAKSTVNTLPEQSYVYSSKALQLADSIQYIRGKALAYKWIGIYFYKTNNIETLDNWLKSLELFKSLKDKNGIANLSNNIGSLYYNRTDDAKALEYYLQSLKLSEEIDDKNRIATALGNIGNTYLRKSATQSNAIKYLLRALPMFIKLNRQDEIVITYTNLGEGYLDLKKVDSALYYYKLGLKASNNVEELSTVFIWNNIGKAYAKKGDFNSAIIYQNKSIALAQKLKSQFNEGKSLLGLADTYYTKGDINQALDNYKKAEPLLIANRANEELRDTYHGLYKSFEKKGDYSKANKYLNLFTDYKDSIYNTETDRKLSGLQFDFDLSKKETQIKILNKDNALNAGASLVQVYSGLIYKGPQLIADIVKAL